MNNAKEAERIVLDTLFSYAPNYRFEDVSNDPDCYYKGDIKAISPEGQEFFIEVKDDSRIGETGNILCEEEVYYKASGYSGSGNMNGKSDIYVVVSKSERRMYVIDFKVLKQIYRKGEFKVIDHAQ